MKLFPLISFIQFSNYLALKLEYVYFKEVVNIIQTVDVLAKKNCYTHG